MRELKDYQFFTNTKEAVDAMYEAVNNARSSVYLETYLFSPHDDSFKLAEKLKEKVLAGLDVKIIFDGYGVKDFDEKILEDLKKAGAEVVIFNPFHIFNFWRGLGKFLERNHRKVLIVDQKIGFIGGVNISGYKDSWLDLQVKVTGPAVQMLLKAFSKSYLAGGGPLDKIKHLFYLPITREKYWRVLQQFPKAEKTIVRDFYLKWIRGAKKKITLVTPYFLPDEEVLQALEEAGKRGVKIDIILPWETDHHFLTYAARAYWGLYTKVGLKLYLVKKMIHAKAMMVDDKVAFIGSSNFDPQTFYRSHETNLIFSNKEMLGDLKNIFKGWKKRSRLFKPLHWDKRSWRSKFWEFWGKILRPFL